MCACGLKASTDLSCKAACLLLCAQHASVRVCVSMCANVCANVCACVCVCVLPALCVPQLQTQLLTMRRATPSTWTSSKNHK